MDKEMVRQTLQNKKNQSFDTAVNSTDLNFHVPEVEKAGYQAIKPLINNELHQETDIEEEFEFTKWAYTQYCQKIGVPAGFLDKNPARLQQLLFDYWKETYEKPLLLRCRDTGSRKYLRGALSKRYAIIDDVAVFHQALDILGKDMILQNNWESDRLTIFRFYLNNPINIDGEEWYVGMSIDNSEVGYSTINIDTYVSNYTHNKYFLLRRYFGKTYKRKHIGNSINILDIFTRELQAKNELIRKEELPGLIQRLIHNSKEKAMAERELKALEEKLGKKVYNEVLEETQEIAPSAYGLAQSISKRGQSFPAHLRQMYETLAGQLLEQSTNV